MAKKKTVKKKTTPKKKTTTKKAGVRRPTFKVNAAANAKLSATKKLFGKFEVGTMLLRIPPPLNEDGLIFMEKCLHYGIKSPFDPKRTIAPGCLRVHGDGNCYICALQEYLNTSSDPIMKQIADDLYPNDRPDMQAFVWDPVGKEWYGPKIFNLPKKISTPLNTALSMAETTGSPAFCDEEFGQAMGVTRVGTGQYDTDYTVQPTGMIADINKDIPDWYERTIKDMWAKSDVKVLTIDQQKEQLVATYPDLPWEVIEGAIG